MFTLVPDFGLCVFVGTVLNEEGKEKKISFALTPFKPINTLAHTFFMNPRFKLICPTDPYICVIVDFTSKRLRSYWRMTRNGVSSSCTYPSSFTSTIDRDLTNSLT